MSQPRSCPAFWISLIPEQEHYFQVGSVYFVRWYCSFCCSWHAYLMREEGTQTTAQVLICLYDKEPANWLDLIFQNDIPHCPAYWWLCARCQSWHLKLIKIQNGETTCLDTPTP